MAQTTGLICDATDCGEAILVGQAYITLVIQQVDVATTLGGPPTLTPSSTQLDYHREHVPPAMEAEYNAAIGITSEDQTS